MGRQDIRDGGLKHMHKLSNMFAAKKAGWPKSAGLGDQKVGPWYEQFMQDTNNCSMATDEDKDKLHASFGKILALAYCMGYQDAKEKVEPKTLFTLKPPAIIK